MFPWANTGAVFKYGCRRAPLFEHGFPQSNMGAVFKYGYPYLNMGSHGQKQTPCSNAGADGHMHLNRFLHSNTSADRHPYLNRLWVPVFEHGCRRASVCERVPTVKQRCRVQIWVPTGTRI